MLAQGKHTNSEPVVFGCLCLCAIIRVQVWGQVWGQFMARLTDRAVKTARVGRHEDGDGLHLIVSDSSRRSWVLRYQMNGARHDMGLGLDSFCDAWRAIGGSIWVDPTSELIHVGEREFTGRLSPVS
jgi:hypothetical protein